MISIFLFQIFHEREVSLFTNYFPCNWIICIESDIICYSMGLVIQIAHKRAIIFLFSPPKMKGMVYNVLF